eukprot:s242_g30.t1
MWRYAIGVIGAAGQLCASRECAAIVAGVCPSTPSPESCGALWETFLLLMGRNSDSVPNIAANSADAPAAVFKWRHLAHRGQMLSKSMLRSECWVSVPHPDIMQRSDIAGRPSCLSSRCLLDSSCHDRHIVSELLHLAKQIDLPTAQKLFQATKDLFAWKRFEQTPMLFYPSLKSQVWFGEEDYPELLGAVLQHFATIKEEFLNIFQQRGGKLTPLEEEYSGRQGWWCWDVWSAVDGWEKERCEQLPTLCRVLRPHLPHSKSSTLAAYLQEEVALFGLPTGEKYFAMHNDGSNARVALLIPLTQGEHSALVVNGERRSFGGDGRVLGFDASFDHEAAYNSPSGEERWVLSIAVSHPQFDEHLAKGLLQTPPPDVKMVDDPHRWRQRTTQVPLAAASDSMGWLELLSDKNNAVLLGLVRSNHFLLRIRSCSSDDQTCVTMSLAFAVPSANVANVAKPEVRNDFSKFQSRGPAFVSGYSDDASVNQALTSMAAMFVVSGGVRWRERRSALRAGPGGPSTAVVGSPQETYQELVDKSEYLRDQHWTKTFHASFMGGAYVGMAGLLSLVIGGNMASEFITQKAVFAALFPINLLLVLTTGGQLFTGNSATMAIGIYEKKCTTKDLLRNWSIAYIGNICGCLLIDAVARYTGMFTGGAQEMAVHTVMKKCSATFGQTVVKGIMCNWLVCMAVWLCTMAKDLLDHWIDIVISCAPLSWGDILVKNLIPVTIGNAIAGAFVVGAGMSFSFGRLGKKDKEDE